MEGVHQIQTTYYNPNDASLLEMSSKPEAKGITMYSSRPYAELEKFKGTSIYSALPSYERRPIYKITRNFYDIKSGQDNWITMNKPMDIRNITRTISSAVRPHNLGDNPTSLAGNGFRIRFKLPGTADRIVFEQYNLRALVNSYQDGFGDNWKVEYFNSANLGIK